MRTLCVILLFTFLGCNDVSSKSIEFDMIALPAAASAQRSMPFYFRDLLAPLYRENPTNYFSPTSFIIKLCTVIIGDEESGRLVLLDKSDAADCKSFDVAKGDQLARVVELKGFPTFKSIKWFGIFFLPEISITYASGTTITYNHPIYSNCTGDSLYVQYGCNRGRAGYDIDLYEANWGDTSLTIYEGLLATLFIDTENMLEQFSAGVTLSNDYLFFPAIGGMKYRRYKIKKASHAGTAATDFPHQLFLLFNRNDEPVYGHLRKRDFTGSTFASAGRLTANLLPKTSFSQRSDVIEVNSDGSYKIHLEAGGSIPNLKKEAHTGTLSSGEQYFTTYEEAVITPLGKVEITSDTTE